MNLIVATSTIADGDMTAIQNRTTFLEANNINIRDTTRVNTIYEGNNYLRYHEVDNSQKGSGMFDDNVIIADALITRESGHALFLQLADCIGAAIFDPNKKVLMLSHLGRHAIEQNGGYESIKFLINNYDCNPADLRIWLTPAAGKENYPLFAFNNRSMKDVLFEQLQTAGISLDNIYDNPADTTKDLNYFSHSQFLQGNRPTDGRYAIVAMMTN